MFNALQGIQTNKQTGDKCCCMFSSALNCCFCCCFAWWRQRQRNSHARLSPQQQRGRRKKSRQKETPFHILHVFCRLVFILFSFFCYFAPLSFNFRKANALRLSSMREHPLHQPPYPPSHTPAAGVAAPPGRSTPTYSFCYLCQRTCSAVASCTLPTPPAPVAPSPPPTMLFVFCFSCVFVHLR